MSLNHLPEHVPPFVRALEIAERESRALEASWQGLNKIELDVQQLDRLAPPMPRLPLASRRSRLVSAACRIISAKN